jgi:hypothetical protein
MKSELPQPDPIPKVGDGVTHGAGSDSYPGTIIEVNKTGKTIVFQEDSHKHLSGSFITGDAKFEYSPNPDGRKFTARWTVRDGKGAYRYDGRAIGVGHRRYYQDPSF